MVDLDAAGDFLRLLAPETSKFTFQTFDDDKGRNDLTGPKAQAIRREDGGVRSLAQEAVLRTERVFEERQHSPGRDHWKGLTEIAEVFQAMADKKAEKAFYLSELPTGMGKTTIAVQSTKAMLHDQGYKDVGVIYFLSRLEEIERLAREMELDKEDFAVLTSDANLNALGNQAREKARVLFTTQQRLEAYAKDGTRFEDMPDLRYRDKPRAVRVWDEAILPSMTLTAEKDGLYGLIGGLRRYRSDVAEMIEEFAVSLKKHDGEFVTMPDIYRDAIDLSEFRSLFEGNTAQQTAEALWYLSGRVVRVRKDPLKGVTSLDYEDILPDDIAPLLILDASGGLRQTYRFWEDGRRNLKRLHSPKKSYAGLTIHHLDRAAGKRRNYQPEAVKELADDTVKIIKSLPESEQVLVVHFKPSRKGADIVQKIRSNLPNRAGIEFCNWGRHTATNEYQDIKHVILVGVLNYNLAQYEAMGRGAKKARTEDTFPDDDMRTIRLGEISHHIFQAAGRGAIRKHVDGGCPEGCNLYAIFSTHKVTGFPKEQLGVIFPDATIINIGERKLTGKVREAFEFIESVFAGNPDEKIPVADVQELVSMKGSNWNQRILCHRDFEWALKSIGAEYVPVRGGGSYFVKG